MIRPTCYTYDRDMTYAMLRSVVDCAEENILVTVDGETSCRETVDWRIVLRLVTLVLLVLWSGSMDDGCNLVTQTIHSPRHKLHSIETI